MNCRSAESLFSALVEDELSQKERRFLEAHLLACRKCSVGLKEMRAAMELFRSLPSEDTSPHFEQDVMTRIRSGEGLRPSVVEWVRGLLAPAWLRPAAVAGAGACAVWIAALVAGPMFERGNGSHPVASVVTPAPSTTEAPAPAAQEIPAASVAQDSRPVSETGTDLASGSVPRTRTLPPATADRRAEEPSGLASASSETPAQGLTSGGEIPTSGTGYVDEYITDQFYLERGNGGSGTPSITPVSGRPSDDVYIVF
jgi:hypothetical protein